MKNTLKKFALKLSLRIVTTLQYLVGLAKHLLIVFAKPLRTIWKPLKPITLMLYKLGLVIQQRSKRFFHAQHKFLAVITHRFAIHIFVGVLASTIILTNVAQAKSVRSDAFLQQSLLSEIVKTNSDVIITAETTTPTQTSYIDTSAAVKITPVVDDTAAQQNQVATTTGGTAIISSNVLHEEDDSRTEITRYTVKNGDTASTIAAQFGVSTKTVLWSNDLDDPDLIKPGDELVILPVTGLSYIVQKGDTVDSLAEKYEAKTEDIIAFNGYITAKDMKAGDSIIIPDGKKADPPPPPPPPAPEPTQLASVRDVFTGSTTPTAPATTSIPSTTPVNAAPSTGGSGQWPTTTRRISQYFGYGHTGLDIDGECGDPVYASDGGTVVHAGWNGAYGISVKVQHGDGTVTHYAHLQSLSVGAGQQVGRGQGLGQEGTTGRSSGCHLHYEVIRGGFVNPFTYTQ